MTADRGQLYRVIHNLAENALQMGAANVAVRAAPQRRQDRDRSGR